MTTFHQDDTQFESRVPAQLVFPSLCSPHVGVCCLHVS